MTCIAARPRNMPSSPEPLSTLVLVQRAQADDDDAKNHLFERFLPRVQRIAALRLGRSTHELLELEDITQDAVIDALRGLSHFDVRSDGRLCSWLGKIVENRIRMVLREGRAHKRGAGKVQRFADRTESIRASRIEGSTATPSQNVMASEFEAKLHRGIDSLEPKQRDIIIQRFFCDMSYEEIAEDLGLSSAAVARTTYSRALKVLNSRMKPTADDERLPS